MQNKMEELFARKRQWNVQNVSLKSHFENKLPGFKSHQSDQIGQNIYLVNKCPHMSGLNFESFLLIPK
jgi:hypothetical protein